MHSSGYGWLWHHCKSAVTGWTFGRGPWPCELAWVLSQGPSEKLLMRHLGTLTVCVDCLCCGHLVFNSYRVAPSTPALLFLWVCCSAAIVKTVWLCLSICWFLSHDLFLNFLLVLHQTWFFFFLIIFFLLIIHNPHHEKHPVLKAIKVWKCICYLM